VRLPGGESSEWVDKYIESWVNIAGPMLGVPKALASLSSGEMRDTAQLGGNYFFFIILFSFIIVIFLFVCAFFFLILH
jgi:hypothetical protein